MALPQSALSELLESFRTGDGVDMICESVRAVLQELVEFVAARVIGAERYEDRLRLLAEQRAHRGPRHRAQREPTQTVGHQGW